MNKKIEQCFVGYGLTVNGNNAYGVVKGYEVNATFNQRDMYYPMTVHISCYATEAQRADISAALKNRKDIKGLKSVDDFGVLLRFNDLTTGRLIKRFPEIMNWVIGMLEANGALGAEHCPHCGKQLSGNASKCDVDGMTVTLDSDCVGAVNTAIDQRNADFAAAPNNYLRGFLGALIGGIVGAALVVVFYLLNFVSIVSGIAAVALGGFLPKVRRQAQQDNDTYRCRHLARFPYRRAVDNLYRRCTNSRGRGRTVRDVGYRSSQTRYGIRPRLQIGLPLRPYACHSVCAFGRRLLCVAACEERQKGGQAEQNYRSACGARA